MLFASRTSFAIPSWRFLMSSCNVLHFFVNIFQDFFCGYFLCELYYVKDRFSNLKNLTIFLVPTRRLFELWKSLRFLIDFLYVESIFAPLQVTSSSHIYDDVINLINQSPFKYPVNQLVLLYRGWRRMMTSDHGGRERELIDRNCQ